MGEAQERKSRRGSNHAAGLKDAYGSQFGGGGSGKAGLEAASSSTVGSVAAFRVSVVVRRLAVGLAKVDLVRALVAGSAKVDSAECRIKAFNLNSFHCNRVSRRPEQRLVQPAQQTAQPVAPALAAVGTHNAVSKGAKQPEDSAASEVRPLFPAESASPPILRRTA